MYFNFVTDHDFQLYIRRYIYWILLVNLELTETKMNEIIEATSTHTDKTPKQVIKVQCHQCQVKTNQHKYLILNTPALNVYKVHTNLLKTTRF